MYQARQIARRSIVFKRAYQSSTVQNAAVTQRPGGDTISDSLQPPPFSSSPNAASRTSPLINIKPPRISPITSFAPASLPSLKGQSHIRFNPSSMLPDSKRFIESLHAHFETLPKDRYAPEDIGRFRQYSRVIVLPFEDKPRVYWTPGHWQDGSDITYYNQGEFNFEHHSERRVIDSIPEHMRSEALEKLILTDVSLCDWSADELRHPIIVGVHFIKTAPCKKHPVSKTTPNAFHQDGHKFSFVHLIRRRNAIGGLNMIAGNGGAYAGKQPEDIAEKDVLARFYLENPLDTWAAYDSKCSHYAGPVMQLNPDDGPSERSVMICDIEPMKAAVCPI